MTEFLSSSLLAFIQGATEFLPISSSAHLVILPQIFGWRDQGLAFDIAVHVGTLVASLTYFRDDIWKILVAWIGSLSGRENSQASRLGWFIVIASVPVAVAGALFHGLVENELRSPVVIGSATVIFALLLWYADRFRRGERALNSMNWKDALLIGLGQAVALVPGHLKVGHYDNHRSAIGALEERICKIRIPSGNSRNRYGRRLAISGFGIFRIYH